MVANDFYYNGYYLSDFGFVMAAPETEDSSGLTREPLMGEITPSRPDVSIYGAQYSDTLELNFLVFRGDCKKQNLYPTFDEIRAFQSWITSTSSSYPLIISYESGELVEFFGIFTDIQPVEQTRNSCYTLTFKCNSPFGYKKQGLKMLCEGEAIERALFCDSDDDNYIYPTITLTNITSGTFSISNEADGDSEMSFVLDGTYSEYVIDCKYHRIVADGNVLTLSDAGWTFESLTDYNNVNSGMLKVYWLRLLPGLNNLTITGTADCLIEFNAPIKIGGYC